MRGLSAPLHHVTVDDVLRFSRWGANTIRFNLTSTAFGSNKALARDSIQKGLEPILSACERLGIAVIVSLKWKQSAGADRFWSSEGSVERAEIAEF